MGISNENEGAMSEYQEFLGVELKESYWRQACRYWDDIENQGTLALAESA